MVKCDVEVIDVIVEHPVYGQLTGQLSICTPEDVESFMQTIEQTQAGLLSSLTDGVHPVSYTHLDVYKRQKVDHPRGKTLRGFAVHLPGI